MDSRQQYLAKEIEELHVDCPSTTSTTSTDLSSLLSLYNSSNHALPPQSLLTHTNTNTKNNNNNNNNNNNTNPTLVMKNIIQMWRSKTLFKTFLKWYKFSFGTSVEEIQQVRQLADAEFIESLRNSDQANSQASRDLAIAMEIIERLQNENSALSHEVKNLLLRSFGIRSAACNVIANSKRGKV